MKFLMDTDHISILQSFTKVPGLAIQDWTM